MTDGTISGRDAGSFAEGWSVKLVKELGFPIVMCFLLAWFTWTQTEYIRETLAVKLTESTKAIEGNSKVISEVSVAMEQYADSVADSTRERIESNRVSQENARLLMENQRMIQKLLESHSIDSHKYQP